MFHSYLKIDLITSPDAAYFYTEVKFNLMFYK